MSAPATNVPASANGANRCENRCKVDGLVDPGGGGGGGNVCVHLGKMTERGLVYPGGELDALGVELGRGFDTDDGLALERSEWPRVLDRSSNLARRAAATEKAGLSCHALSSGS